MKTQIITILLFTLLFSCKKEDTKPEIQSWLYKDSNVEITTCQATEINGKFQVEIKGQYFAKIYDACEIVVTYNNQIILTWFGDSENLLIDQVVLTSDTLNKASLKVYFLPNSSYASTHQGKGIELTVTYK